MTADWEGSIPAVTQICVYESCICIKSRCVCGTLVVSGFYSTKENRVLSIRATGVMSRFPIQFNAFYNLTNGQLGRLFAIIYISTVCVNIFNWLVTTIILLQQYVLIYFCNIYNWLVVTIIFNIFLV